MLEFEVGEVYPEQYPDQLSEKIGRVERMLQGTEIDFDIEALNLQVHESENRHYRMRAEFSIWHDEGEAFYCMYSQRTKARKIITHFDVACGEIASTMKPLLESINASEVLKFRLFQVEFLASRAGQVLVTLIYHKSLDEFWEQSARILQSELGLSVIGRSKGQKLVLDTDYVTEVYSVNGSEYRINHPDSAFSQPNAGVCDQMLSWAVERAQSDTCDLLELYCGSGGFTLPLSRQYRRVLATEISKKSIQTARLNCEQNDIKNVEFVRMSSEEFVSAYRGERRFNRLSQVELSSYEFEAVFVDPPRAGLDPSTLELVEQFPKIIYVSCNPETLFANLTVLAATHRLHSIALFDQFPYTEHIELGVVLMQKQRA